MSEDMRADSIESAGVPEDEIEVTDEMAEAGIAASCLFDCRDPKRWEVVAVYRAMEFVRRSLYGSGSSS
jgi:hypothetical protein